MNVALCFGMDQLPVEQAHPQVVGVNQVGVEVELEGLREANHNTNYWRTTNDGSLRNGGKEFVMNGAFGGRSLFNAAIELDTFLTRQNPDASWRCSTHVHVNARQMTVAQLKRLILADAVYEKLLFKLSGFHRYTSNFCPALGYAQEQVELLSRFWSIIDEEEFLRTISETWNKYTGMNLQPLARQGTVEFRSSAAEWRKGKIIRLANRFLALYELAMAFEGPEAAFIEHMRTIDPKVLFRKGLARAELPEGWQDDLEVGFKLAYDIVALGSLPYDNTIVQPQIPEPRPIDWEDIARTLQGRTASEIASMTFSEAPTLRSRRRDGFDPRSANGTPLIRLTDNAVENILNRMADLELNLTRDIPQSGRQYYTFCNFFWELHMRTTTSWDSWLSGDENEEARQVFREWLDRRAPQDDTADFF